MANTHTHHSVIGDVTGKVGPVIAYFWRGIYCIRTCPQHYRDAKTPKQLLNRQHFNLIVATIKSILPSVKIGFKETARQMSEYNAAFSYNFQNSTIYNNKSNTWELDPKKLQISIGSLPSLSMPLMIRNNNSVIINWFDNSGITKALPSDQLMITVYNHTKQQSILLTPKEARRASISTIINIPNQWKNDEIHLYGNFVNQEEKVSDSIWIGSINESKNDSLSTISEPSTLSDEIETKSEFFEQKPINITYVAPSQSAFKVQISPALIRHSYGLKIH